MQILSTQRVFGGTLSFVKHDSLATKGEMSLSVFVPEGAGPFPVVYWLSGLTCTANNFTEKAGAYRLASQLGLIIVAPDTSPRGEGVANDEAYDLGQGAGFYLNATQAPWASHFQMETYVVSDLKELIDSNFPVSGKSGICGHSMGGHGALTLSMKYPELYRSVSAFSPIVSPMHCPWGQKAFSAYLGEDQTTWAHHDACALIMQGKAKPFDDILIDQGLGDPFLESQLKPELIEEACAKVGQKLTLRRHVAYDHSYYFIKSFIDDHLKFHAERLK